MKRHLKLTESEKADDILGNLEGLWAGKYIENFVTKKLESFRTRELWYTDSWSFYVNSPNTNAALMATKITGIPAVPAGYVTFQTTQWPSVGQTVEAQILCRNYRDMYDPKIDPSRFYWVPGNITMVEKDKIRVSRSLYRGSKLEAIFYYRKKKEDNWILFSQASGSIY